LRQEILDFAPCGAQGRHRLLEPALRRLLSFAERASTSANGGSTRIKALWDILLVLPEEGLAIADFFVIHPLSLDTHLSAAGTARLAVARRDQQKQAAHAKVEPHGYTNINVGVWVVGSVPGTKGPPTFARGSALCQKCFHSPPGDCKLLCS
jgi:hypothetical protein